MNMKFYKWLVLLMVMTSNFSLLASSETNHEEPAKNVKVKYKESGRIDFESLLIEGERKKPELSVVTGNVGEKDSGLMIMRESFTDMMMNEFGEVVE
jgi:hypothetical protein